MAASFIRLIMARAVANIQRIFRSRHEVGKQIGETIGSLALGQIVRYVVVNGSRVDLKEIDRIYIAPDGTINHEEHGHCVAVVYEGNDGNHYKHTADGWYFWNGSDWAVGRL